MSYIEAIAANTDFVIDGSYSVFIVDCTNNDVSAVFDDIIQYIGDSYAFTIRRTDSTANTLIITASNGQTIDGGSSYTLPDANGRTDKTFLSFNNNWISMM